MIPTKDNQEEYLAYKYEQTTKDSVYGLSKDLHDKGYQYDDKGIYIPFPDKTNPEFYLKVSRSDSKKPEIFYAWAKQEGNAFRILSRHKSTKLILDVDSTLNKNLMEAGEIAGISVDKETFKNFIMAFKNAIINSHRLDILKDIDFEFPEVEKEENKEPIEDFEPEEVFSFDSYSKLIQEEALAIINDGTLYEKYVDSISITHAGNTAIKEQLALITVSLFIGEPIHTELNALSGKGKTDISTETVKNIPDIYVNHLSTVSPKNIYYDRDSYGKFNILIFDDVKLTENNIDLLKVLTDNNKPVKEIRTIIDQKAVRFTLDGTFLVILTYAKDNPDEELLNRLYRLNMVIDESNESKIKNKIKENTVVNAGKNKIISKSREFIQAAIQYLIEQDIKIFNPFTVLFDPSGLSNRNISHFITMVKSKSFFHTNTLKPINFAGKRIYIGSYDDFDAVGKIWSHELDTQKYKLNSTQKKILEILPEKTRDEAADEVESKLKLHNFADTKEKAAIMDTLFTREKISKLVGVSKDTVRYYLDQSKGTATTLCDKDLVGRFPFDPDKSNSPLVYYKIKKSKEEYETAWEVWKKENSMHFNTFESKITILLSLLYMVNITVNKRGENFLKNYCENENHYIDFNDYDSYYNFINDALSNFNLDEYAIKLEDARFSDLKGMIDLFESPNNIGEKNKKNSQDLNSMNFSRHEKVTENAQNEDSTNISYGVSDFPCVTKQQDSTSIFNHDVKHPDDALKVCKLLVNRDLTCDEIFDEMYGEVEMFDSDEEDCYYMSLEELLNSLDMGDYISWYSNENNETVYCINSQLKQVIQDNEFTIKNEG